MELNEKEKELLTAIETKMAETMKGVASIDEVKSLQKKLNELNNTELIEKINKRIDSVEVMLKEQATKKSEKPIIDQIKEALHTDAIRMELKNGRSVSLELKAASDMSFSGTSSGQAGRVEFAPGIGFDPLRGLMLANIIPEYPTDANAVFYIDALNEQGAPAFVTDATAAPQKSWTITQLTAAVKDVAVYAAYSSNMVDDIDNFASQINQRLMNELMVKYDEKLYSGNQNTNPEEFNGLSYYAQVFSVADNSLKTASPNLRDVLNAACAKVEAVGGKPNFVLLNPIDFRALKNTKLTTGEYALPWDISPVLMVDGLMVIANSGIAKDNFLVGDSTKGEQHIRQSLSLVIDPYTLSTKRAVRVTLAKRAAFFVRSGDAKLFVKGTISAAKTALTA